MSDTEHHIGKVERVLIENDIESTCEKICQQEGYEKNEYHSSFEETLRENGYRKYVLCDGDIYKVIQDKEYDDDDIYQTHDNPDGTIGFVVRYYNGGCSFSDALESALRNRQ